VKLLLGARANITCKDKAGNTCLHYAAQDGLHDVMEELLVPAVRQQQLDVTNRVSCLIECDCIKLYMPDISENFPPMADNY